MEPFIVLAVAAVIIVVLAVTWSRRSRETASHPPADVQVPHRGPDQPASS